MVYSAGIALQHCQQRFWCCSDVQQQASFFSTEREGGGEIEGGSEGERGGRERGVASMGAAANVSSAGTFERRCIFMGKIDTVKNRYGAKSHVMFTHWFQYLIKANLMTLKDHENFKGSNFCGSALVLKSPGIVYSKYLFPRQDILRMYFVRNQHRFRQQFDQNRKYIKKVLLPFLVHWGLHFPPATLLLYLGNRSLPPRAVASAVAKTKSNRTW